MRPSQDRRPPPSRAGDRRDVRLLAIALLLLAALLPGTRMAVGHAYHPQEANETSLLPEETHDGQWLAQSFVAGSNYSVSRVEVRVADLPVSDALAVSVRADSAGAPSATNLTEGTADGPDTEGWLAVDLAPFVPLVQGRAYWIVAHSQEASGEGYNWWHAGVDVVAGTAATSADGSTWTNLSTDFTYRVYGYETPAFEYEVLPTPDALEPGNTTVFTVWFNNTGDTAAETLWVNLTYPAELRYVDDDAADEGGVRSGTSYSFTNVTPGPHAFNVTASAEGGAADGTVATLHVTLEAADHAGAPTTHDERQASVTLHNAVMRYDAEANATALRPAEEAVLQFTLENAGNGTAAGVWVNLTLPAELRYVGDDAGASGGNVTGAFSFAFTNRSPGVTVFNVTVAAEGGGVDGATVAANATFEATDALGSPLNASAMDLPFTLRNARLQVALAATPSTADPGDRVSFLGNVTNAGGDAATNLTLQGHVDPNATYVSSTPAGTWDPANRTVRWTLSRVEAGASAEVEWTVEVPPGTADDAALAAWLRTAYEDDTGTPMPAVNVSTSAGVQAPVFAPVLAVDPAEAQRYDEVAVYLYYNNTGNGTAARAWANWTLDGYYTLLGLVPDLPHALTLDGFSVNLTDVAPGDHLLVARLRVLPAGPDGLAMDLAVNWTATDANGHPLPVRTEAATVTLRAPTFSPELRINRTAVQRGDLLEATAEYDNGGSVAAQWVWLNWTFGGHYVLVALSEDLPFLATEDGVAVLHTEVAPGPHALTLTLQVVRGLEDGLALPLDLQWTARDGNGRALPEASLRASAELHAPRIDLNAAGPREPVPTGSVFVLEATVANTGRAPATGTLALDLPPGVAYVDTTGGLEATLEDGRALWSLASLGPGESLPVQVRLRADGPGESASFQWTFTGTDGRGSPPQKTSAAPLQVAFLPPPPLLGLGATTLGALVALASSLLLAGLLLWRRRGRQPNIEQVFVTDDGGTLLAHRSHSLLAERDEDILGAMLTAVQEFVRDAFSQGTKEHLRTLDFGERTILVERGGHHCVALVCRRPDRTLRERLRRLSREIERRFGGILENWNGDMAAVRGIQNVLPILWTGGETEEG